MRYMLTGKNDASSEAGKLPSMESVEKLGKYSDGFVQTGKLIDGAGLLGSRARTRLIFRNGESTVKRGPYSGDQELLHAMLLMFVRLIRATERSRTLLEVPTE